MNAVNDKENPIQLDQYVVIGNPIAHSKSPAIHTQFAQQTAQALAYDKLLAPVDGFADSVKYFQQQGGKGANVTVPFKLDAFAYATQLTPRAQAAGAVNTLKFDGDAVLGDNTDGVGIVADITRNAGVPLHGKRVLLLGAGGAARGVILPLLAEGIAELVIANRTLSKAQELVALGQQLGQGNVRISAAEFTAVEGAFDVIINATSASLQGDVPPIPSTVFAPQCLAYDMMYGAQLTAFLSVAKQHGAHLRDGLGMLVEQAAEAFYLWRGVRPDTAIVLSELRKSLESA